MSNRLLQAIVCLVTVIILGGCTAPQEERPSTSPAAAVQTQENEVEAMTEKEELLGEMETEETYKPTEKIENVENTEPTEKTMEETVPVETKYVEFEVIDTPISTEGPLFGSEDDERQ